ncbi:MAG: hypothetical protein H6Q31_648 [Bacteroidetes bacterium]|jgi:hypothetical protein|nr:hypothetical protein [Bacteroidota bacterium]
MGTSPQENPRAMDNEVPRGRDHESYGTKNLWHSRSRDHSYGGIKGHSHGGTTTARTAAIYCGIGRLSNSQLRTRFFNEATE